MTVINTNVAALQARTYALQAADKMQTAMERLSSGLRINSAADDAAGLAVSNKMESQLRGMEAAIRNSQDGISLVQTAESGMSEVSNMIIRMRELAVQMANGVYSDSDRTNAQLEVTALLAEIDKIADNTAFNNVKVLDGSYQTDIRAGNTNAETIPVTIDSAKTSNLGSVDVEEVAASSTASGTRTADADAQTVTSTLTVAASEELQIGLADEVSTYVGDVADGYSVAYTFTGDGFTFADGLITSDDAVEYDADAAATSLVLTVKHTLDTNTIAADAASSETADSVVTSTLDVEEAGEVTIALSSAMATASGDATYWTVDDETAFTIDATTGTLTSTGAVAFGDDVDLEIKAYTYDADGTDEFAVDHADADGVSAFAGDALTYAATQTGNNVSVLIHEDFVTAAAGSDVAWDDSALTYSIADGDGDATGVEIDEATGTISINDIGFLTADATYSFDLTVSDAADPALTYTATVTITLTAPELLATENLAISVTESDKYVDTISLSVIADEDHLEDVDVSTQAGAARAVTILDEALDEISSSQAKLGAIQNRLQHNIDNLTTGSMLTQTARGRITDADFARETSELSKQQILGQAATSMLAQANQSKQSILALLQ